MTYDRRIQFLSVAIWTFVAAIVVAVCGLLTQASILWVPYGILMVVGGVCMLIGALARTP